MLLARSAWAWYGRFLDTSPVTARIMAAVPILVAADSVTQLAGDKPWNWRRYEEKKEEKGFGKF